MWWELVDRGPVIRAAADFAAEGGALVLAGPSGFGHLEAANLAVRQMRRYGWVCHDLTSDGPVDARELIIAGLESIFPTAQHGVPQRAQLGGMGVSRLSHHVRTVCADLTTKHCLVAPYADSTQQFDRGAVSSLLSIALASPICFLLTSLDVAAWSEHTDVEFVELAAFDVQHVRNCLMRGSHTEGFPFGTLGALSEELRSLTLSDGKIVPQAAYAWLRQRALGT